MTKRSDDKSRGEGAGAARPTDEELMLFVDDELEGDRHGEVASFVLCDATAKKKVDALRLAGGLVRDAALAPGPGDSIADAVMAEISRSNGAAKVVPLRGVAQPGRSASGKAAPANDNSRRIYTLLVGAIAAAAALTMWARSAEPPSVPPAPVAIHEPAQVTPQPAPSAEPEAPKGDGEGSGAEVAAVDFGTHGGTIFYIAGGAASSPTTTAVVWLNDDSAGGQ